MTMPPTVEDVMSTVRSLISWGSSVSPIAASLHAGVESERYARGCTPLSKLWMAHNQDRTVPMHP